MLTLKGCAVLSVGGVGEMTNLFDQQANRRVSAAVSPTDWFKKTAFIGGCLTGKSSTIPMSALAAKVSAYLTNGQRPDVLRYH